MSPSRRSLAAIHVAKKDRGLDDPCYRDLLDRIAGVRSAADLDEAGADRVLAEFRRLGFVRERKPSARNDRRPIARKVVAMWLTLWNLDEVGGRNDRSIDGFVHRVKTLFASPAVQVIPDWKSRIDFWLDVAAGTQRYLAPYSAGTPRRRRPCLAICN